jgi:hypothetical protein
MAYSTTGTDIQTACDTYTWIDGNTYTSSNNTATHTLTNSGGCDSLVTLDLSIPVLDTKVTDGGSILTSHQPTGSYQWLDCDNNYALSTGDTSRSITALLSGNFAVAVTKDGCTDTSTCYVIFGSTLEVYPNPTTGRVILSVDESYGDFTVTLYDAAGRLIGAEQFSAVPQVSLRLDGAPGVYLMAVRGESGEEALIKVMKE